MDQERSALHWLESSGMSQLFYRVTSGMPQADVLAGIELLGRQVLPEVRRRTR